MPRSKIRAKQKQLMSATVIELIEKNSKYQLASEIVHLRLQLEQAFIYKTNPFDEIIGNDDVAHFLGYAQPQGMWRKRKQWGDRSIVDRLKDEGVISYKYTGRNMKRIIVLIPYLYAIWRREHNKLVNEEYGKKQARTQEKRRRNRELKRTRIENGQTTECSA